MAGKSVRACELCGAVRLSSTEHVIPRCFYPPNHPGKAQRITIKACHSCNSGTSEDDAFFRDVVVLCGAETVTVAEVWAKAVSGLEKAEGKARMNEILRLIRPQDGMPERYRIYPAESPRILRSVRKVVRGLCAHHHLDGPIEDEWVWTDVLREPMPGGRLTSFYHHAEPDVADYFHVPLPRTAAAHSIWFVRFFGRAIFVAVVFRSAAEWVGTRTLEDVLDLIPKASS